MDQDSGYEDSQSKPVIMYKTTTNEILGKYGSIREANRETNIDISTIARQAKYHRPSRKPFYFRYEDDETNNQNDIVGKFDYDTDELLDIYFNIAEASRQNNWCEKTVRQQCNKGKPKQKYNNIYFNYVVNKCEQTIESKK